MVNYTHVYLTEKIWNNFWARYSKFLPQLNDRSKSTKIEWSVCYSWIIEKRQNSISLCFNNTTYRVWTFQETQINISIDTFKINMDNRKRFNESVKVDISSRFQSLSYLMLLNLTHPCIFKHTYNLPRKYFFFF